MILVTSFLSKIEKLIINIINYNDCNINLLSEISNLLLDNNEFYLDLKISHCDKELKLIIRHLDDTYTTIIIPNDRFIIESRKEKINKIIKNGR